MGDMQEKKRGFVWFRGLTSFFFSNKSDRQVVFKNTFWLGTAQGITGLLNFLLSVYVIRSFGATEYGKFAFALSFVFLFSTLFDFGLSTTIIREFARDKSEERHFSDIFTFKAILGLCVVVFIGVLAFFVTSEPLIRKMIFILCVHIFLFEALNFIYSLFRARQRMEIEAFFRFIYIFILGAAVLLVLFRAPSILNLSLAYMFATFFTLLFALAILFLRTDIGFIFKPSFNTAVWKTFLIIGFYLALSKGVGDITMYTDSVFLGYMDKVTETGWYNAALRINKMVLFPMGIVGAAVFPAMTSVLSKSEDKFKRYWLLWMKGSVFFSGLILTLVLISGADIIEFIYSSEFLPATIAFKLLIVMAALLYIHTIFYHVLIISNQQKRVFWVLLLSAIVNVVLNIMLIPKYTLNGAALASVISQLLVLLLYVFITFRHTVISTDFTKPFLSILIVAAISGATLYLSSIFLAHIFSNLFLSLVLGAFIYSIIFVLLSGVSGQLQFNRPI